MLDTGIWSIQMQKYNAAELQVPDIGPKSTCIVGYVKKSFLTGMLQKQTNKHAFKYPIWHVIDSNACIILLKRS